MGMKHLPRRSSDYIFEIIMRRYEARSTVMTSNRPLEDWGKLLGDVPSATAILDRFLHHAQLVTITGKSYRLREQAKTDQSAHRVQKSSGKGKTDQSAHRVAAANPSSEPAEKSGTPPGSDSRP